MKYVLLFSVMLGTLQIFGAEFSVQGAYVDLEGKPYTRTWAIQVDGETAVIRSVGREHVRLFFGKDGQVYKLILHKRRFGRDVSLVLTSQVQITNELKTGFYPYVPCLEIRKGKSVRNDHWKVGSSSFVLMGVQ